MKLILVRHGETDDNKNFIVGGQRDTKLNENGIQQAKDLALKLKNISIDVAYTSPLTRALRTAEEIMVFHNGVELKTSDELKERNAGEMQGKTASSIEQCAMMGLGPTKYGEPLEQFQNRVFKFTKKVSAIHQQETVLFVSHGGVMMALLNAIENKPASNIPNVILPGNGEFKVIESIK